MNNYLIQQMHERDFQLPFNMKFSFTFKLWYYAGRAAILCIQF